MARGRRERLVAAGLGLTLVMALGACQALTVEHHRGLQYVLTVLPVAAMHWVCGARLLRQESGSAHDWDLPGRADWVLSGTMTGIVLGIAHTIAWANALSISQSLAQLVGAGSVLAASGLTLLAIGGRCMPTTRMDDRSAASGAELHHSR